LKRRRKTGRAAGVGHWCEGVIPAHFCKVSIAPGFGMLPILDAFMPYLVAVPHTITLKTSIGCTGDINIMDVNGRACLDQG
jgi:hypothetical protein